MVEYEEVLKNGSMSEFSSDLTSGVLSDTAIRAYWGTQIFIQTEYKSGDLAFDLDKQLQPGSIDLRFRNEIYRFKSQDNNVLSYNRIANKDYIYPEVIPSNKTLIIKPGEIILTTTLELISLSSDFAGIITGRSSFARLGLMVQCCQDFVNPGLKNTVALQLINLSPCSIELNLNVPICQLVILKMLGKPSVGYDEKRISKYNGEKTFIPSAINEETEQVMHIVDDADQRNPKGNKLKKRLKRTFNRLLPSLVMLSLITPAWNIYNDISLGKLAESGQGIISNIFFNLMNTPIHSILALVFFILLIILEDGET